MAEYDKAEHEAARQSGEWKPSVVHEDARPLVLRARRGERIRVFLVNQVLTDDKNQAAELPGFSVEVAPPRLFVEHRDELGRPDRRTVSPRVSVHP